MRDLRDIKLDADAATEGPWQTHIGFHEIDVEPANGECLMVASMSYRSESRDRDIDNATFVASARTDVPDLVAQVKADDALLLQLEWCYPGVTVDGRMGVCPACRQLIVDGHLEDCEVGRRCDDARARKEAKP